MEKPYVNAYTGRTVDPVKKKGLFRDTDRIWREFV